MKNNQKWLKSKKIWQVEINKRIEKCTKNNIHELRVNSEPKQVVYITCTDE